MRERLVQIIAAALLFAAGWAAHDWLHECPKPADTAPNVETETKTETKTEIVYVPKETIIYKTPDGQTVEALEDTDVDVNIGKPELNVKVNGKPFTIQKADDEQYIFDKNKLQLNQTTTAALSIDVPTIDQTRRWEVGVGISKNGPVGMIGFPIRGHVGGWAAGRSGEFMGGVSVKF